MNQALLYAMLNEFERKKQWEDTSRPGFNPGGDRESSIEDTRKLYPGFNPPFSRGGSRLEYGPSLSPRNSITPFLNISPQYFYNKHTNRLGSGNSPYENSPKIPGFLGDYLSPISDINRKGHKIDPTRPMINNRDGSFSTERTITIEADGKHYLIPTIINGRQFSTEEAINLWKTGKNKEVGVYSSAEEADKMAKDRSNEIGILRKGIPSK